MRIRSWWLLPLFFFILSNIVNATGSSILIPPVCQPSFDWSKISIASSTVGPALALLALTVSFDVVAIGYALSRLFPNAGIRSWIQGEYWEIMKSAIIIVAIFGAISFVGNLSYLLVPNIVSSPISYHGGVVDTTPLIAGAEGYLCMVNSNLNNTWNELGIMAEGTGVWSTLQVGFKIPIPLVILSLEDGVYFLPFGNWLLQTGNFFISPYGSIINDLINFVLFPFTAFTLGLITTLPALAYVGLTFFIPLGLIFRAFPFIRGIGGTLIAIGLGLCLVIPSVFVLFNYQVTSILSNTIPIVQPNPATSNLGISNCKFPTIFGTAICTGLNLALSTFNFASGFIYDLWAALPIFSTDAIYIYMNKIFIYGIYVILQLLIFAIDLIILYPLIDNLARVMGGSIRLSIGGKLRLAS